MEKLEKAIYIIVVIAIVCFFSARDIGRGKSVSDLRNRASNFEKLLSESEDRNRSLEGRLQKALVYIGELQVVDGKNIVILKGVRKELEREVGLRVKFEELYNSTRTELDNISEQTRRFRETINGFEERTRRQEDSITTGEAILGRIQERGPVGTVKQ